MYIRVKTTPNSPRKSVQIVEGKRIDGKVKQKIVRHVGIATDDDELERLQDVAAYILAKMEAETKSILPFATVESTAKTIIAARKKKQSSKELNVNLVNFQEKERVNIGFHDVYGSIFDELGFNRLLGSRRKSSQNVLRDVVMARLAKPQSKLSTAKNLSANFGIETNVNKIYRMLDHLDEKVINKVMEFASSAATDILQDKLDVFFFDCTTLYFESFTEDDLRQKGFSKDHKSAETQVLLALLVTQEGLPVGYRVYPGSTWEGNTLREIQTDISKIAPIGRAILVADSGLLNKANIKHCEEVGQKFILAARIKNLPATITKEILNRKNYSFNNDGTGHFETEYQGKRLILSYSPKRARKDADDRDKQLHKIKKRYANKSCKTTLHGKAAKYLKIAGEGKLLLNEQAIANDASWDGLHGLITNVEDLDQKELIEQYRGLWQVEATFRLSKHDLRMRPIFHWTQRRIKAHIAVCFMALTCMRHFMYQCSLRYKALSAEVIRLELEQAQISVLEDISNKYQYAMPSKSGVHTERLFKLVGKQFPKKPFKI